jgi:hypothetical protein
MDCLRKTDIWLLDCVYDEGLIDKCERDKSNESCSSCPNCMVVSVSRLRDCVKEDIEFFQQLADRCISGKQDNESWVKLQVLNLVMDRLTERYRVVLEEK